LRVGTVNGAFRRIDVLRRDVGSRSVKMTNFELSVASSFATAALSWCAPRRFTEHPVHILRFEGGLNVDQQLYPD
jgi:hypothetical protein